MRKQVRIFLVGIVSAVVGAAAPAGAAPAEAEVAKLGSPDPSVRERAAGELRRLGTGPARPEHVSVPVPAGFTGTWVTFYTTGAKARDATYQEGRMTRELTYFANGNPLAEASYDAEGKVDGRALNWWPNGQLMYEVNYSHGKHHGREAFWGESGELETERFWEDGVRVDP